MNPIKRKDEQYQVRKSQLNFQGILEGRENTLLVNGECFRTDEIIRFIELDHKRKRTGRECFCRVEHVYGDRLIKYRRVKAVDVYAQK
jgi:hypothetical protein